MKVHICHNDLTAVEWISFRQEAGWSSPEESVMSRAIKNSDLLVSARVQEIAVGMARVLTDYETTFFLTDIIVKNEWRHKGIACMMINDIIKYATNMISHTAYIYLMSSINIEPLYKGLGFNARDGHTKGLGMEMAIYPSDKL